MKTDKDKAAVRPRYYCSQKLGPKPRCWISLNRKCLVIRYFMYHKDRKQCQLRLQDATDWEPQPNVTDVKMWGEKGAF